jgi:hypothetical protein
VERLEDRLTPSNAFFFSTGTPDGLMASAAQIAAAGKPEIETRDDFIAPSTPISSTSTQVADTVISQATFIGLIPRHQSIADIKNVSFQVYDVFPAESNTARTPNVPTRTNSPSDIEIINVSSPTQLTFTTKVLKKSFTAANSVTSTSQIHVGGASSPDPVTGKEVQITVTFTQPLDLPAGHYFIGPEVQLGHGTFLWLSAPKPITTANGGTPSGFPAGTTDLQTWIRDLALQPDWLRIGTDLVGGATPPTFNASFSLSGQLALQPHISSISPTSAAASQGNVALSVFGSNFTSLSHIVFNGDQLSTTFVSPTEVQATVPSTDLFPGTTASISVNNPSLGHPDIFSDNSASFTVT